MNELISEVMPMFMVISSFAIPLITAMVEGFKRIPGLKLSSYAFLISIGFGILLAWIGKGIIIMFANAILPQNLELYNFVLSFKFNILLGILWGLSASGLYSGFKSFGRNDNIDI